MLRILALSLALILPAALQAAGERHYIGSRSGADLYEAPNLSARKAGHLDRLTDVRITRKQRSWWHIETIGQTPTLQGWVLAGAVRQRTQPSTASRKGSSLFSGFASLFGYGRDSGTDKTAVLGVRGLEDEKSTARAKTDTRQAASAVKWMEGLHVSQQDVNHFIREGDLNP